MTKLNDNGSKISQSRFYLAFRVEIGISCLLLATLMAGSKKYILLVRTRC
jgi:hypothetical protein